MKRKSSILFVDDEVAILESFRVRFRKDRDRWDMFFVASGEAALEKIRQRPFDVIISDMRMPIMNGAELLLQVQQERPDICRIILSGQSHQGSILQVLPAAHRFLSKPLDADSLRSVINRVTESQQNLQNNEVQTRVGRVKALYSSPKVLEALNDLLAQSTVDMDLVAELISSDPAIAARLLQITLSSYAGAAVNGLSIERAVKHLGSVSIKRLLLKDELFLAADSNSRAQTEDAQGHALQVANFAKKISLSPATDEVYIAGLLHNIGGLVLAACSGGPNQKEASGVCVAEMEFLGSDMSTLGVSHSTVGAYLLSLWGLPETVVEAVANCHSPCKQGSSDCYVLLAVHVAIALLGELREDQSKVTTFLNEKFVEEMQASEYLSSWRSQAADIARNVNA